MRREELEKFINTYNVDRATRVEDMGVVREEGEAWGDDIKFINKHGKAQKMEMGVIYSFDKSVRSVMFPDGTFAGVCR